MPSRPFPARTTDTTLTSNNHCGHCRKHPETPGLYQYKRFIKEISRYSYLSKRRTRYQQVFDKLSSLALNPADSVAMIAKVSQDYKK